MSLLAFVQDVLVVLPLLVSTARMPSKAYALVGFVWKPLLSPAPLVTAAFALGAAKPVLIIGAAIVILRLLVAVTAGLLESCA